MTAPNRVIYPLLAIFAILSGMIVVFSKSLERYNVETTVLLAANGLFFLLNVIVSLTQKKALGNSNPNVFVRSVIAGMMIKMFVCAIAVLAYVTLVGPGYNKKGVFISLFIYLIYLAVEVGTIMRLNKRSNA
ncbi:MAG: hypothetical protein EOO13_06190 [Chitinophagaceae bacterium]|nr:MAG: hypothetical protein EOO13_06190 [Chitinophagaceae bacterium]